MRKKILLTVMCIIMIMCSACSSKYQYNYDNGCIKFEYNKNQFTKLDKNGNSDVCETLLESKDKESNIAIYYKDDEITSDCDALVEQLKKSDKDQGNKIYDEKMTSTSMFNEKRLVYEYHVSKNEFRRYVFISNRNGYILIEESINDPTLDYKTVESSVKKYDSTSSLKKSAASMEVSYDYLRKYSLKAGDKHYSIYGVKDNKMLTDDICTGTTEGITYTTQIFENHDNNSNFITELFRDKVNTEADSLRSLEFCEDVTVGDVLYEDTYMAQQINYQYVVGSNKYEAFFLYKITQLDSSHVMLSTITTNGYDSTDNSDKVLHEICDAEEYMSVLFN